MFAPSRRTQHDQAHSRRGVAMFMALGALVIIAVLVAGSSYVSMQEARLGQNQLIQSRAFAAAEYGLNKIQSDWDKTPNLQMAVGAIYDTTYTLTTGEFCDVKYQRLNAETFWIVSEGRAYAGNSATANRQAVKHVGAILRLRIPTVNTNGAVMVNGNVALKGSALSIGGNDQSPSAWAGDGSCSGITGSNLAGVTMPTSNSIDTTGHPTVTGSPATQKLDAAGILNTYIQYGDETWNSLKAQATTISGGDFTANPAPAVNATGDCDKTLNTNWGEPWRSGTGYVSACKNYFPIIYFNSSVKLKGNGRGQGIILVEGDITFSGNFEFDGLIIAKDDIMSTGGNVTIYGSMMAAGANLDLTSTSFMGSMTIQYSACALTRALRGSAQVVQAKERAWAELF